VVDARQLDLAAGPYRVGVIGDPIAHSLSPALHQPALDLLGIPAVYERWHTSAGEMAARVASLRDPLILGANVTVPHKLEAMRLVDDVSSLARRAGAVNTIVNQDGRLFGDNTDIAGFGASIASLIGADTPARAVVLGAGGAARAVVLGLEGMGVPDIVVANRDPGRARQLAEALAPAPVRSLAVDDPTLAGELRQASLLVNATSLGWHAGETPLDLAALALLPAEAIVADLTYRDTDLLLAAGERGLRAIDGLAMLVYQGARAFELFTGFPAPVAVMFDAARRARAAR
jgi:shikimate dehydrogenase